MPAVVLSRLRRRPFTAAVLGAVLLAVTGVGVPRFLDSGADLTSPAAEDTDPASFPPVQAATPVSGPTATVAVGTSIDRTGRRDVTAALLDFLHGVPDGTRVLFPAGARYRVEGTLELVGRSRLVLDGNGAEFFATEQGSGVRAHWRLVSGSDLVLRQMTIRGTNADGGKPAAFHDDLQWQHGVDVRGARRVLIEDVRISDVYGDCVYVGSGPTSAWAEDVQVRQSTCERNGRQGIAITAARRVLVERSHLAEIGLMTVDLEPNGASGGATDVTFRDNVIGTGPRQQFLGIGGDGTIVRLLVERNVLVGKALTVLMLTADSARTGIAVLDNRSDTALDKPGGAAMVFRSVQDLRVEGNTAPLSGRNMALVLLSCADRVAVVGNSYPGGVSQVRRSASCG
jgi:polygalacturonase